MSMDLQAGRVRKGERSSSHESGPLRYFCSNNSNTATTWIVIQDSWPGGILENAGHEVNRVCHAFGGSHGRQVLSVWEYSKDGGGFTPCLSSIHQDVCPNQMDIFLWRLTVALTSSAPQYVTLLQLQSCSMRLSLFHTSISTACGKTPVLSGKSLIRTSSSHLCLSK